MCWIVDEVLDHLSAMGVREYIWWRYEGATARDDEMMEAALERNATPHPSLTLPPVDASATQVVTGDLHFGKATCRKGFDQ